MGAIFAKFVEATEPPKPILDDERFNLYVQKRHVKFYSDTLRLTALDLELRPISQRKGNAQKQIRIFNDKGGETLWVDEKDAVVVARRLYQVYKNKENKVYRDLCPECREEGFVKEDCSSCTKNTQRIASQRGNGRREKNVNWMVKSFCTLFLLECI